MENKINFNDSVVASLEKDYLGVCTIDGVEYSYTLRANWNDWDGWSVDYVMWDGDNVPENIDEIDQEIGRLFLEEIYEYEV
jgi:hypothetical protein